MSRSRVLIVIAAVLALLVSATGLALAASPAALWHMDETSGSTMTDSSGHGINGQLQHVQTGVAGIGGTKGYGFNGSNSRVIVPDDPALDPGSKDLVVSVHVAFTSDPGDDYDLIRKGRQSTPGGDWKIEIVNVSGKSIARCYLRGSSRDWQKTAGPDLADGAWHTITCEKHATTVRLTVDGQVWQTTRTIGSISNDQPLAIGAQAEGGDWLKGSMDEVSITVQ
jgi:Concanavalin A-like lectin/glucanases superfamily